MMLIKEILTNAKFLFINISVLFVTLNIVTKNINHC